MDESAALLCTAAHEILVALQFWSPVVDCPTTEIPPLPLRLHPVHLNLRHLILYVLPSSTRLEQRRGQFSLCGCDQRLEAGRSLVEPLAGLASKGLFPAVLGDGIELLAGLLLELGALRRSRRGAPPEAEQVVEAGQFQAASVDLEQVGHRFEVAFALSQQFLGLLLSQANRQSIRPRVHSNVDDRAPAAEHRLDQVTRDPDDQD